MEEKSIQIGQLLERFIAVVLIVMGFLRLEGLVYHLREDFETYLNIHPNQWQLASWFSSMFKSSLIYIGYVVAGMWLFKHTKIGWILAFIVLIVACVGSCFQIIGRYYWEVPVSLVLFWQQFRPVLLLIGVVLPMIRTKYKIPFSAIMGYLGIGILLHIDVLILYFLQKFYQ